MRRRADRGQRVAGSSHRGLQLALCGQLALTAATSAKAVLTTG